MNIKTIPIEELKEYENNPRNTSEQNIEFLTNSIKEFGFKVPCCVDVNNVLITGHARVKAAKKAGLKEIPCVIADDLTPEQINAFRLVDNKMSELSGWDFEKLDLELKALDLNFDMTSFGFNLEFKNDISVENSEVNIEDFNEEQFEHECPRCGFKF